MRNSLSPAHVPLPKNYSGKRPRHFANRVTARPKDWFEIKNAHVENDEDDADSPALVYIYDEIGFWGTDAQTFVRQLLMIDKDVIELHLNSPGGQVFDGVAIYNALKAHPATVNVIVDSLAASAASFIAQAGDTVVMQRNATMMIHDASAICLGNEQDMLDTANVLGKISNNIADIYAQRAGEDTEFWRALMKEEIWYSADEAVEAGLADSTSDDAGDDATDHWDLTTVFNHSGRGDAPSPKEVRQIVFNRAKEASVGAGPKNTAPEGAPSETETPPEGAPAPVTEPAPAGDPAPATDPAPADPAPADPAPAADSQNKATGFAGVIINGVLEKDPAKVQAYVAGLEGAAAENKKANRKAFIKNLCDSKKIAASQVDGLEAFVIGTDTEPGLTDKQYESWCASWNAAPSLGVLATGVAGGVSNPTGDPQDAANQEIQDAVEIVRQHQRSNMPKDQLEKTASYQKLKAANALDQI